MRLFRHLYFAARGEAQLRLLRHADTLLQHALIVSRGWAFMNDDQIGDWGDVRCRRRRGGRREGGLNVQKAEWNAVIM